MYHTRIAPSPTGHLHLGTARTAYFNYLAARATGGRFLLRIDDTDAERSKPEYTAGILACLDWLGLGYDHIEYQSKRAEIYALYAGKLLADGRAARLAVNGAIVLGSTVLVRGDGSATYHFATVCDDVDMGINFVIRGVDHEPNLPKHLAIAEALKVEHPRVEHVGLIHRNGKKLSKRDGAASILDLREQGYHPGAILNCLLRLGWGPTVDDKSASVITKERAISMFFTGGKMRKAAANFDQAKLDWLNKKYRGMKHE